MSISLKGWIHKNGRYRPFLHELFKVMIEPNVILSSHFCFYHADRDLDGPWVDILSKDPANPGSFPVSTQFSRDHVDLECCSEKIADVSWGSWICSKKIQWLSWVFDH